MPEGYSRDTEQLHGILEAAVDGIVLINDRGIIEGFNPGASRIFGYEAQDVIGKNVSLLMPTPDRTHHDEYIKSYVETGERKIIGIGREVVGNRKDGTLFPMDLSVGEIQSGSGSRSFVGIIRDITSQRDVQNKLAESEQQLQLRWEHASIPMIAMNKDGEVERFNPAAHVFFQRTDNELVGLSLEELVHPDDLPRCLEALSDLQQAKRTDQTFPLRLHRPDETILYTKMHCTGIYGEDNALQEILAQIVDRTAEVTAEQEAGAHRERLAHATRIGTMGELAAGIAHEVNQPLTAISVYANACIRLLESGEDDRETLSDALAKIGEQSLRAGEVIRRLRGFVSKRESEREMVDVNECIREVVQLARTETRAVDFEIVSELTDNLPQTRIDAIQIQQVLLNLIRNGKEAMTGVAASDVPIRVTSRQDNEGQVEVSVFDRGGGVAPEAAQALFDPFFTTKSHGMGMGLSISRSIVVAHGGRLSFSANVDGGTRFYFTLPVALGVET